MWLCHCSLRSPSNPCLEDFVQAGYLGIAGDAYHMVADPVAAGADRGSMTGSARLLQSGRAVKSAVPSAGDLCGLV